MIFEKVNWLKNTLLFFQKNLRVECVFMPRAQGGSRCANITNFFKFIFRETIIFDL